MVNNVANGTMQYYTQISAFKDVVDIYGSVAQMSMMMLEATELGYDTNGMLGFDPEGLKNLLVSKGLMEADQRVNMTFSMGHRDENHQNNKLAHNRIEKDQMIKVVE
jgi:nitroreductase